MHLATDALGKPLRFILTAGPTNDITQAGNLMENFFPASVIAAKGYEAADLLVLLQKKEIQSVIPSKLNRKVPRVIDTELYKERHLIECCLGKLKHFRRVFSRFAGKVHKT